MAASAKPRPTVYYIRHGETDWNVTGRLQGRHDVPLNARGRDARHPLRRNPARPVRARRPRSRRLRLCFEPAGPCPRDHGLGAARARLAGATAIETDQRLAEISFGEWEGFTIAQLHKRDPAAHRAARARQMAFPAAGRRELQACVGAHGPLVRQPRARHGGRPPMAAPRAG